LTEELLSERRGAIQWITFNRPEARNALTWHMYDRLAEECDAVNQDSTVRAVVLTGAGGQAFVAGTDISQFRDYPRTEQDALDYEARGSQVMSTLEAVRVPTIAAIAGACTGAGGAIAAACDLRIATPSARYGFPIARTLGNTLSMGNLVRLTALIGQARVKDLIFTARLLSASEALAAGFVNEVTADEESLLPRAEDLAATLASHAPLTLETTKEALRRIRARMMPEDGGSDLVVRAYMSQDFKEGVEAFLARRPPEWRGE
jgi:enoyl-CoA hydratase/carnithine racemase